MKTLTFTTCSFQMLSTKDDDLAMLADHMGHDLHIHANHCRLQTYHGVSKGG